MDEAQKEEVINLITNTWDFCGSALDAVKQWQIDEDVNLTLSEVEELFKEANERMKMYYLK